MPPRIQIPAKRPLTSSKTPSAPFVCLQCRHASLARATTPAAPIESGAQPTAPIQRFPPTQPPSYKPPEFRKSQLHRQYQSLLRSSPLTVIFQHNNLKATEWSGIRRELAKALQKVDEDLAKNGDNSYAGGAVKMQIVQTGIFASAVQVVEFWDPKFDGATATTVESTDPATASSRPISRTTSSKSDSAHTHGLSLQAYQTAKAKSKTQFHGLEPILSGPLAVLSFPTVSPQHLKAALSILAPSAPNFPAPRRKINPAYHEPQVQNGLNKLLLLAARVEGKVFDVEGTKWVGGIDGGLEGLRGQLVAMLQGVGAGVTSTLEAAGKTLYVTMEGRKGMLGEEQKGSSDKAE